MEVKHYKILLELQLDYIFLCLSNVECFTFINHSLVKYVIMAKRLRKVISKSKNIYLKGDFSAISALI